MRVDIYGQSLTNMSPIRYRILYFLPFNVAESMLANYVNGRYIKNSKGRNMTMVELLKWVHGSVYVNVIRKSNNSANNSSHGVPTKYRFGQATLIELNKKQEKNPHPNYKNQ